MVNAKPMTFQEYNYLREWELPANQDGADQGYLVEYVDGGKPNTKLYPGYVSWSPKEQFENAYKALEIDGSSLLPHQQRVVLEHADIADKLIKLQAFIGTTVFASLKQVEQNLLKKQVQLLYELKIVLGSRIVAFPQA